MDSKLEAEKVITKRKFEHTLAKFRGAVNCIDCEILASSHGETGDYGSLFDNGLVGTVTTAYNEHHNLILRPDDFLIAILTQLSFYINGRNSEKLRSLFVEHKEGQKTLTVSAGGTLYTANYPALIESMRDEIMKNLKTDDIKHLATPTFSTTSNVDRIVCAAVLMGAMKNYFTYKFRLKCGIPKVELLGTEEDYVKLLRIVDTLLKFDNDEKWMTSWHAMMRPIFEKLLQIKKGQDDGQDFFSCVCSYQRGGSGPSYLSGWITTFCCFDKDGEWQVKKLEDCDLLKMSFPKIDTNDIPPGLVSVPVIVEERAKSHTVTLIAGSNCFKIHDDELTIQPEPSFTLLLPKKND